MLPLLLLITDAHALDAETWRPAGSAFAGHGGFQALAPTPGQPGAAYAGLQAVYASDTSLGAGAALEDLVGLRLLTGYTLGPALRVDLDVPFYPYATFSDGLRDGATFGDLRLRGVVAVARTDSAGEGVALVPSLALPGGGADRYLGSGGVGAGLAAAVGIRPLPSLLILGDLGFEAGPVASLDGDTYGSVLTADGGLEWATGAVSFGAELTANVSTAGGFGGGRDPVELHAYTRYNREAGVVAQLGVGTALTDGLGAPGLRLVGGLAYQVPGATRARDTDRDGLVDAVDACPTTGEDLDGNADLDGCPEDDDDGDGIPDAVDACRSRAEDRDSFEDGDGCPEADNDQDGSMDARDACPEDPGGAETNGCPDTDGDGFEDKLDACPEQRGTRQGQGCPDSDGDGLIDLYDACPAEPAEPPEDGSTPTGCPALARVESARIQILEEVRFETGTAAILPESYPVLAAVGAILRSRPDIGLVRIEGHTDSVGSEAANERLSAARADAVMKHLIVRERVDPARLRVAGLGETRPLDTNQTEAGRARNRRVEFVIP